MDGFQGEQREAIIMSLVRNNLNDNIGFLSDHRRMNVAVTRAKRHFFLVGSSRMLRSHKLFASLYQEIKDNGMICSPSEYLSRNPWKATEKMKL